MAIDAKPGAVQGLDVPKPGLLARGVGYRLLGAAVGAVALWLTVLWALS